MLPYCGNFYGNGHTVSGLYCKNEDGGAGFFGSLNYPAVSDLHIARSYFEGNNSGGIAGYSGGATLNMCSVGDDVTVKGVFSGGLLGSDGGYGTIENCFALADVSGNTAGGLVGQNTTTIRNCFTNAMQPVGHGGSFENVYYAEDTRDYETPDENGYLPVKPDFEGTNEVKSFADGEIAYLLQSGIKGEIIDYDEENDWEPIYGEAPQIWGQKIGTDKYPALSNAKVYEDEYKGAKLYRNEIDGNEILLFDADKKSVTAVLGAGGAYTLVFADYDEKKLSDLEALEITEAQAVRVGTDKNIALGAGDKIMLWDNFTKLTPLCEAYEIK